MHVGFDGIFRHFFRRLEQRPDIHVESKVGECRGDDLRAAVMPILPHLGDKHTRAAAFLARELFDFADDGGKFIVAFVSPAIDARDRTDLRAVAPEHFFHRVRNFAHARPRTRGLDRQLQKIALAFRALGQRFEGRLHLGRIARCLHLVQPRNLLVTHRHIIDIEHIDRRFVGQLEFVDADDHILAPVHARLPARRRFFNAQLRDAGFDSFGHAAHLFHFVDDLARRMRQRMRQRFDVIGTRQRVDHLGYMGFVLQDKLRVARDARREFRGQRDGFVQRIGVQRLRAAQHGRQRFHRGTHHIVVRVLFRQRHAACLAVGAQHLGALVLRAQLRHHPVPEHARRAQLRHFHEEVHADAEEERKPRRERIDLQPLAHRRARVFHAVRQREGQFLHRGRARLMHVIAGDRDRIEFRHLVRGVFDDVGHDPHRRRRRIDIGVAHHELFQNIVLNGAGKFFGCDALLFSRHDEVCENGDHRPVHRHRDAHLVERNAVEQDLHVLDGIDRNARLADIAGHARMIAVISAMCRQIERNRKAHLPGGQILAIEGVGFFGCRKARILANGPGPARIHRAAHTAHERHLAGQRVGAFKPFKVGRRIERLDRNAFGRSPGQALQRPVAQFLLGKLLPTRQILRPMPPTIAAHPALAIFPITIAPAKPEASPGNKSRKLVRPRKIRPLTTRPPPRSLGTPKIWWQHRIDKRPIV